MTRLNLARLGLSFFFLLLLPAFSSSDLELPGPHVLEKSGHLFISYSRYKTVIETVKISVDEVERSRNGMQAPRPLTEIR